MIKKLLIAAVSTVLACNVFGFSVDNQTDYVAKVTANFVKNDPNSNWFFRLFGGGQLRSSSTVTVPGTQSRVDGSGEGYEQADYTIQILKSNGNDLYATQHLNGAPVDKHIVINEDENGNIVLS